MKIGDKIKFKPVSLENADLMNKAYENAIKTNEVLPSLADFIIDFDEEKATPIIKTFTYKELDLDIDKEYDLVTLAQYYINHKSGNRSKINDIILNSFSQTANTTENHRILARLSIDTFWTTNYDNLIEKALQEAGKIVDVKHTKSQLSTSVRGRDATVYKMHGDANMPTEAVLIKDDYEKYLLNNGEFYTALRGDLLTKKFLFLGFSFADPNIDYILGKIRASYSEHHQTHY